MKLFTYFIQFFRSVRFFRPDHSSTRARSARNLAREARETSSAKRTRFADAIPDARSTSVRAAYAARAALARRGGFSLAELIIYLGILGISAGIFGGMLNTITSTQVDQFNQNEVSGQLNFAVQTIQRYIRDASIIQGNSGDASSTLVLQMPISAQNPTTFYLQNNKIYLQQGATGTPQAITNDKVSVDSLVFKKFAQPAAKDVVQIDIALSQTQPNGTKINRSLRSAVTRVNAAAFDSDLIPNVDASYNIGTYPSARWLNGSFSGQVSAGSFCFGADCRTSWANVSGVSGSGSQNYIAKWNTASTINASTLLYDNGTNIGVGAINPLYKLDVQGGQVNASGGLCINGDCKTAWSQVTGTNYWTATGTSIYYNGGNVGVGTASPVAKLQVVGYANFGSSSDLNVGSSADIGNGIYANGASIGIRSGGTITLASTSGTTPYMTVLSSGNVGIGTTAPAAKLQVASSTNTEGVRIISSNYSPFIIRNSADTADLFRVDQNGNVTGGTGNASAWTRDSTNGYLYTSTLTDKVGVATSSPTEALTVNGNIFLTATNPVLYTNNGTLNINTTNHPVNFGTGGIYVGNSLLVDGSKNITGAGATLTGGLAVGTTTAQTAGNGYFTGAVTAGTFSGTYAGTINATNVSSGNFGANTGGGNYSFPGNVGIGTTSDFSGWTNSRLNINGGTNTYASVFNSDNTNGYLVLRNSSATYPSSFSIVGGTQGAGTSQISFNYTSYPYADIAMYTRTMGSTPALIVKDSGNVGIGTTSPGGKLHVAGQSVLGGEIVISNTETTPVSRQGIRNLMYYSGTTDIYGQTTQVINNGGSTIANGYGYWVRPPSTSGVGSVITNSYGLYIDGSVANAANNYGVYQTGAGLINSFAGNVGIGTTSPANKLDVAGSADVTGGLAVGTSTAQTAGNGLFTGTVTASAFAGGTYAGTVNAANVSSGQFGSNTGGGTYSFSGNVGIGTTAPTAKLTVAGRSEFSSYPGAIAIDNDYNGNNMGLYSNAKWNGDNPSTFNYFNVAYYGGTASRLGLSGNVLSYDQASGGTNPLTWVNRLYINGSGNVGIGTTSPWQYSKLDVVNSQGGPRFYSTTPGVPGVGWPDLILEGNHGISDSSNATTLYLGRTTDISGASYIQSLLQGAGPVYTSLSLNPNGGNVGIGTTAPANKLDVAGSADVTGGLAVGTSTAQTAGNGLFTGTVTASAFAGGTYAGTVNAANVSSGQFGSNTGGGTYTFSGNVALSAGNLSVATTTAPTGGVATFMGNVGIGTTAPSGLLHLIYDGATNANNVTTGSALKISRTASIGENITIREKCGAGISGITCPGQIISDGNNVLEMYTTGVSPIVFGTNSVENMRITSGGNVGIGTTGLNAKLSIGALASGDVEYLVMDIGHPSNTYQHHIYGMISGTSNANNYLRFKLSTVSPGTSVDVLTLNGSGNVGIGTTAPANKLDVAGSADVTGGLAVGTSTAQTAGNGYFTGTVTASAFAGGTYAGTVNAANVSSGAFGGNTGGGNYTFSGNVGIGTTSPGDKLDVNGNIRVQNTGGFIGVSETSPVTTFYITQDGTTAQIIYNRSGGNIAIMPTAGNVGIGTTGPQQKLHVAGAGYFSANYNSYVANGTLGVAGEFNVGMNDAGVSGGITKIRAAANGDNRIEAINTAAGTTGNRWGNISIDSGWNAGGYGLFLNSNSDAKVILATGGGNVGIGTTGPGVKLDVVGVGQFGNGTQGIQIGTGWGGVATSTYLATNGANTDIVFGTNGTERMRILSTGNVGIGTSAPANKLDVAGSADVTGGLAVGTSTAQTAGNGLFTGTVTASAFAGGTYAGTINAANVSAGQFGSNTGGGTYTFSGNVALSAGNLSVATTTAPTGGVATFMGNVGIGTTNPGSTGDGGSPVFLHVNKSAAADSSSNGAILALSSNNVNSGNVGGGISFSTFGAASVEKRLGLIAGINDGNSATSPNGAMVFGTFNAGTYGEAMRINKSGNVGIGTTSPDAKLTIAGDYYSPTVVKGNCNATTTIDWSAGNTQHCVLTGNVTFTFSNGRNGGNYKIILKQGATGGPFTVSWPASVRWGSAVAPTLTTTASKTDYVGFIYNGVDSTYDGVAFNANF